MHRISAGAMARHIPVDLLSPIYSCVGAMPLFPVVPSDLLLKPVVPAVRFFGWIALRPKGHGPPVLWKGLAQIQFAVGLNLDLQASRQAYYGSHEMISRR